MLYWALVFLVVAIIAGALGFGGIAGTSAGIAQILFFIFLAFLVISLACRSFPARVTPKLDTECWKPHPSIGFQLPPGSAPTGALSGGPVSGEPIGQRVSPEMRR